MAAACLPRIQQAKIFRERAQKERDKKEKARQKLLKEEIAIDKRRKEEILEVPYPILKLLYRIAVGYQDREELKILVAGSPSEEYSKIVERNRGFLEKLSEEYTLGAVE